MANNAVYSQLPIMARPQVVWSGLDRMDLHRKSVAGDGNCLFASLSDQLYGTPDRHLEIRVAVIQHLREYRPLFENVCLKDDIQQKRATRRAARELGTTTGGDQFEEYLSIMSHNGTYGGEPELVAFVQCFDTDVMVHLPKAPGLPETMPYTNAHRHPDAVARPQLHVCYDNKPVNAHYDSARKNRAGKPTASRNTRPKPAFSPAPIVDSLPTSREIRHRGSDMMKDMMHELVTKGGKEIRNSLEQLDNSDRVRSPSLTSSQQSTSSKRSFDDDGETQRTAKRSSREKARNERTHFGEHSLLHTTSVRTKLNDGLATPASTQDGDGYSDQSEQSSNAEDRVVRSKRTLRPRSPSRSSTPEDQDSQLTARTMTIPHRLPTSPQYEHRHSQQNPRKSSVCYSQQNTVEGHHSAGQSRKGLAVSRPASSREAMSSSFGTAKQSSNLRA